jgi:hypothetical protein
MFWDFNRVWERFRKVFISQEAGNVCGMKMKSKNSIVEMWPLRLKKNATQEEFTRLHASGHSGCERYVEWTRVV